jgi:hypothetical protein
MTGMRSPRRLASSDQVFGLEPDDEGLGNIRPDNQSNVRNIPQAT